MACLMGAYTIVGFESAANLAEETIDAAKTLPKAIVWSVLASGLVGTLFLVVTVLAIQDLDAVVASSYPLPLIIETNLGRLVASGFFVLVGISIFACGLVIMASGSRMVFAMARDNAFLGNAWLRRVSPTSSAPVPAIMFVAVVAMLAELFSESLEQLLAAAAVLPAIIYLITVAAFAFRRDSMTEIPGHFSLGRTGGLISGLAVAWLLVVIGILTFPQEFHSATWVSPGVCAGGVFLYFTVVQKKIRRGEAGVHSMTQGSEPTRASSEPALEAGGEP